MAATSQPPVASAAAPPTLRGRASRAIRAEVGAVAMRLFLQQGFDQTTVDQIAAEAGLSRTSFFRYFGSKEDVVLGHLEESGHRVLDALVARPADEPAWQSLRHAFDLLVDERNVLPEQGLSLARMLNDTPSLKSRLLARQLNWQDLFEPEVARRLGVASGAYDPRPRAVVAAALACLNAAADVWTASDGAVGLPVLLDQAMSALTG
jgi:AcrR family transcriptional regulator